MYWGEGTARASDRSVQTSDRSSRCLIAKDQPIFDQAWPYAILTVARIVAKISSLASPNHSRKASFVAVFAAANSERERLAASSTSAASSPQSSKKLCSLSNCSADTHSCKGAGSGPQTRMAGRVSLGSIRSWCAFCSRSGGTGAAGVART